MYVRNAHHTHALFRTICCAAQPRAICSRFVPHLRRLAVFVQSVGLIRTGLDICEVPFFKKSWSPWVRGFALGGGGRDIHPSMEKGGRENVACRDRPTAGEIGE